MMITMTTIMMTMMTKTPNPPPRFELELLQNARPFLLNHLRPAEFSPVAASFGNGESDNWPVQCTAKAFSAFAAFSAFTGLFAAGSLLFLVSDIVLILNTFGPENKFSLRFVNLMLNSISVFSLG